MNYWDTSCLLKLYVREEYSGLYLDLVRQQATPIFTSVLAETEFAFAVSRKEADGSLLPGAATDLAGAFRRSVSDGCIRLVPLHQAIRESASELARRFLITHTPSLTLRTLDGIHLATAISLHATHLLTADRRLAAAAKACGLHT